MKDTSIFICNEFSLLLHIKYLGSNLTQSGLIANNNPGSIPAKPVQIIEDFK
jgi:hypothetical protein